MNSKNGPKVRPNLKILIVDDMPSIISSMKEVLSSIGFKDVCSAENGKVALNKVLHEASLNRPYDLVISDINMPVLDGLEFLRKVKGNPITKDVHVFMVTTRDETEYVLTAIERGASNYLIKPFDKEKIKKKIMDIFYRSN